MSERVSESQVSVPAYLITMVTICSILDLVILKKVKGDIARINKVWSG